MKPKLYSLVWVTVADLGVEQGRRTFIGQVLSLLTPEQTVMVRTIPGHPGTLQEVPMSAVDWHRAVSCRYVSYATVGGHGSFPVDMLRYDCCNPANFKLVPRDSFTGGFEAVINPDAGTELIVGRAVQSAHGPHFTNARWSSFLWGLRALKVERIER